jgi:hypothetical protein
MLIARLLANKQLDASDLDDPFFALLKAAHGIPRPDRAAFTKPLNADAKSLAPVSEGYPT